MRYFRRYFNEDTIEEITREEALNKLDGNYKDPALAIDAAREDFPAHTMGAFYWTDIEAKSLEG